MAEQTKPPSKRSIYFGDPIAHLLKAQGDENISRTLNTAINRYLKICHHHRPGFSIEEWTLIAEALEHARLRDEADPRGIPMLVEDHLKKLHRSNELDGDGFLQRLRSLEMAGLCATLHYVEIFLSSGMPKDVPLEIAWGRAFEVSSRLLAPAFERLEQTPCPTCSRRTLQLYCAQDEGEFSAEPRLARQGCGPMWVAPYYGKYRSPIRAQPWIVQCQNPGCRAGRRGVLLSEFEPLSQEDRELLSHFR